MKEDQCPVCFHPSSFILHPSGAGWEVGPDGDVLPGIEVAVQGVEFLTRQPQRILAEEQMERWVRRFDGLDDRVRRANRVARLLAAQFA
jgi:hypothetical protein